jgi:putative membrane protein
VVGSGEVRAAIARANLKSDVLNWRLALVRIVSSGLAVVVTVVLLPGLSFTGWQWGQLLVISVVFGVLNAVVKPVLQFFTLRYLVATYGLVVVLINAFLLWLLTQILDQWFEVRGLVPLLLGGLIVGMLGLVFDAVLGTTRPIVDTHGGFDRGGAEVAP